MFCRPVARRAHLFHALALAGAVTVGLVVLIFSSVSLSAVLAWWALVAACEAATTAINSHLARHPPVEADLPRWAAAKTVTSALQGLAFGLGPAMLSVPGEAITVLAPAWAIVTVTVGIVYACAPWPPVLYGMLATTTIPAVVFLAGRGGEIETAVAVCLASAGPFAAVIGSMAIRNVGDLIVSRLDLAALLERQSLLAGRLSQMNEERTRFFSAASHDLRQPLQALGFYVTLLGLAGDRGDRGEMLARLKECADTLDRQFDAILGVAATDAMVARAEPRAVALGPLVARVVRAHRGAAERKGLRLREVATEAAVTVVPEALERVLSNLVANAVRYTEAGGVVVGVRRRRGVVGLVVADSGIGIAAADVARVFEDFFQVGNPGRDGAKGFGLGLAIVKRIADGFGWPIDVASRPGRGTVFRLDLPPATARPAEAEDTVEPAEPAFPPMKVLVVEDDPLVRSATASLIASWNLASASAASAAEGLALLEADPDQPWVVLADHRLGAGEDGLGFLDAVEARHGGRIRSILMTGDTDPRIAEAAAARGVTLIRKPLKPIRLRTALAARRG